MSRSFAALAIAAGLVAFGLGCRNHEAPSPAAAPPTAAPATAQPQPASTAPAPAEAPKGALPEETAGDPTIVPVYPRGESASPAAAALCDVLHGLPIRRRAACCQGRPGLGGSEECVRNTSAALLSGAIVLDDAKVAACAQAMERQLAGCDWVALFPILPPAPPECMGLVRGTVAVGGTCRSSLECAGDAACVGAGPTTKGTCRAPADEGSCTRGVDVLASSLRDASVDDSHPACRGYCDGRRCVPRVELGSPCTASTACASGAACVAKVCVAGSPGKAGEPCFASTCAAGLRCTKEGLCAAPKPEGAMCTSDPECRGSCVRKRPTDAEGTCVAQCFTAGMRIPRPAVTGRPAQPP